MVIYRGQQSLGAWAVPSLLSTLALISVCSGALRPMRSCRGPEVAQGKAIRNLRAPGVPGNVQGLRCLQAGEEIRFSFSRGGGKSKGCGKDKRVFSLFSGCRRLVGCPGAKAQEAEGPAVSRRKGNPTLINLLANEAY